MKIHPKTQQGKKVQQLFLDLLHQSEYKNLSDFARENNIPYHSVYHRIFPQNRWIDLDHVNRMVSYLDNRKSIVVVGDEIRISRK